MNGEGAPGRKDEASAPSGPQRPGLVRERRAPPATPMSRRGVRRSRRDGASASSVPKQPRLGPERQSSPPEPVSGLDGGRRDGASAPSAYPTRKPRPRLPSFDYRGPYAYHIILLTQGRSQYFTDSPFAHRCIERLQATASRCSFRLLAFCLMPDHLHALVLGNDDTADLLRFVQRFKQVTAFEFKRGLRRRLWQQSFYDRTLRGEEDLAQVAEYILGNPVEAGLVSSASDYP